MGDKISTDFVGTFRVDDYDYAKDGGKELLPRRTAFESRIFNDSIEIRLKNTVHPGKSFLAAIISIIVYQR